MPLPSLNIVTPDNLKSILTDVLNNYTSKLHSKLSVVMDERKNTVPLTTSTTTVSIGLSGFDKNKDILHVYKDNVLVETGYTISTDNLSVTFDTAISATTDIPVNIKFTVIEAVIVTV